MSPVPTQTVPTPLELARSHAAAFVLSTFAFLKQRGIPIADWAQFTGGQFAPTWPDHHRVGDAVIDEIARACEACGAEVRKIDVYRSLTRVEVAWPRGEDADYAAELGLTRDETDRLFDVFGPIATRVGFHGGLTLSEEGDAVVLRFIEEPSQ